MKLAVYKRTGMKQSDTNKIRREDGIPGVIYSQGKENQNIFVKNSDFQAILRKIKQGCLATTVFDLESPDGKFKAIIKDIQYHVTTYNVLHIDFMLLIEDLPLSLNVPIQCIGMADCVGIKLGGILRKVIHAMRVTCLPKDIPDEFVLDVKELSIGQSKKLSDIELPQGVKPLAKLSEVAVVIAKR